jgi:hypothetical protein
MAEDFLDFSMPRRIFGVPLTLTLWATHVSLVYEHIGTSGSGVTTRAADDELESGR